jgi:hypothetical protein
MSRLDLIELEDLPWFPDWLRDPMTGYLKVVIDLTRPYDVCAPVIARALRDAGLHGILDLASGGGGPWPGLREAIGREGVDATVTLSDMHPNRHAAERLDGVPGITYRRAPVSALEVADDARRMRTLFTGLHHFGPEDVRAILRDAQEARVPFLAAEATRRSVRGVVVSLFIPLLVLVLMPRVRPRKLVPLMLTYVLPVLPLLIWWDGFASTLRTYGSDELRTIARSIEEPGYEWAVSEVHVPGGPVPVTQIVGRPREAGSVQEEVGARG